MEGRYLFGVEPVGIVHVYDKENGRELGVIKPGPEVGRASGWVDVPFGISAHHRDNGEYLIFVEEDTRGKVIDVSVDAAMREEQQAMMSIKRVKRVKRVKRIRQVKRNVPGRRHG